MSEDTSARLRRLKNKANRLPKTPGVYIMRNKSGEIIYVGKAAVLKNRVRQYFQKNQKDVKTEALVREIADTDWIVVDELSDTERGTDGGLIREGK